MDKEKMDKIRVMLYYAAWFWLGASLALFAKVSIVNWEFYTITIPVMVGLVFGKSPKDD